MTVSEEVRVSDITEMYEKAEKSLIDYRRILLANDEKRELPPAPFHKEWSDSLLFGTGNEAFEAYRESGKTQYTMRAFPLHSLTFPHKDRDFIVIIKQNATMAEDKLKEIEAEFNSNPAVSANLVAIKEQSGRRFSVDVKGLDGEVMNVRIEAFGKGSAIRGLASLDRRPKVIIVDDPQDEKDSLSDTVQENDWRWFLSDLMFLGRDARIFLIGNNLGERCIIERVFANAEELGFKTSRIPVETGGVPAWKEQNSIEDIQKEKENFRRLGKVDIWLRNKMCVAVGDENRIFRKEDFRYFNLNVKLKEIDRLNVYMMVDPAASEDLDSDYRACVVVGVDENDYWFVLDIAYGRWDTSVLTDKIFELVRKWSLKSVAIEQGVLSKALEPWMLKEMPKRKLYFDLVPLKHGGRAKIERIRGLSPRFKAHTIWFVQDADWLAELESELLGMTLQGSKTVNDDLIDALAYGEQVCQAPYFRDMRSNSLPRQAVMN